MQDANTAKTATPRLPALLGAGCMTVHREVDALPMATTAGLVLPERTALGLV